MLLGSDTHMRIEVCGNGLAGIVGDLHHEFAEQSDKLDVLRLYLDNRCLISARREPLQAIDKLRRAIGDGLKVERPVAIISQFLHHVTDTLNDLLLELASDIDDLEDQLLAGKIADRVPELARIRRIAVRLRRHMVPQQHALVSLLSRMPAWIGDDGAAGLRNAIERLSALGHDLDLVQERARLLGDQLSGRLMEATNRNLYVLSIVTTIFLPMTLITGIFGMNSRHARHPGGARLLVRDRHHAGARGCDGGPAAAAENALNRALSDHRKLAGEERLRVALRRVAFKAPQPREPAKRLLVEPVLRALGAEMGHQQIDLALKRRRRNLNIEVGLAKIAIPFRDLVLKNAVIAKCVPGQPIDLAVVLMRIVAAVGENNRGLRTRLQRLEPAFNPSLCSGKKLVLKSADLDQRILRAFEKILRRGLRLMKAFALPAQNAPVNVETNAARDKPDQGRA